MADLTRRREDLERGLAQVGADLSAVDQRTVTATIITSALGHFTDLYAFLRPNEQRDLMRVLVSRIEVRAREIVLELYPDACSALIEAAALAHCGPRAIHSLIRRGLVPAIKVGPWYRLARRPFLDYLERGDAALIEDA